jgi:hypothetical protein
MNILIRALYSFGYRLYHLLPYATDGSLKGAITHASGYPGTPYLKLKLDSCTLNKILDWISQGVPNN